MRDEEDTVDPDETLSRTSSSDVPSPKDIIRILNDVTKWGKTYYLYVGNKTVLERIKHFTDTEQIGADRNLILCSKIVETFPDPGRQRELVKAYHKGKT
ncbi:hypothetical protein, partial [Sodalis sp.]|uniref:hypothetical protein n=1 Tax=Sodalis sp. (in: enterobacteria) TaxID=1898979 RepID=UPI003873C0A9